MHYTEIEMAENMSTSTKISARNPVCRLCGGSHESRYMLQIFSKAGLSKDLYSKLCHLWPAHIIRSCHTSTERCGQLISDALSFFFCIAVAIHIALLNHSHTKTTRGND